MKPTILAILGKPLAGKDTQADLLVESHPEAVKISTGHIIRDVGEAGVNHRFWPILGPYISMMEQGLKLPDEPTLQMLREVIEEQIGEGKTLLIVAGSPRGLTQLEGFRSIAEKTGSNLDFVHINATDSETYKRSAARNEGRIDDTPEVHKVRLTEYDKYVLPVVQRLRYDGNLYEVDGMQTIESVFKDMESHVRSRLVDPEIALPVMARR